MNIWYYKHARSGETPSAEEPFVNNETFEEDKRLSVKLMPVRTKKYGLGWQMVRRSALRTDKEFGCDSTIICHYDNPPLMVQEIMAANWRKEHKKGRKK